MLCLVTPHLAPLSKSVMKSEVLVQEPEKKNIV